MEKECKNLEFGRELNKAQNKKLKQDKGMEKQNSGKLS
jgi:hypothetical protein